MNVSIITLIFTIFTGVAVALVRWRSYLFGITTEKAKVTAKENAALKAEIDRLNAKPRTDTERMRLFARAIIKAKAREKADE